MEAWGTGALENDVAGDWSFRIVAVGDLSLLSESIEEVLEAGDEELDLDAACLGLAACEVLARLKGNWGKRDSHSETLDKWVEDHPQDVPGDLVAKALAAIDRVLTAPCDLLEHWEQNDLEAWKASVADLRGRIAV